MRGNAIIPVLAASGRVSSPTVPPHLSIVLSRAPDGAAISAAVEALANALPVSSVELLLTTEREAGDPNVPPAWKVRWLGAGPARLVPEQWGVGLRSASAPLVAFFSTDVVPRAGWWAAVSTLISVPGTAGAGVAVRPGVTSPSAVAAFLARYSRFLPEHPPRTMTLTDLAGEASIYHTAVLRRETDLLEHGFWEVEFHRRILASGWGLRYRSEGLAEYRGTPRVVAFTQQRCRHAMLHGAARRYRHSEHPLSIILKAPLVPIVLLCRILRRGWRSPTVRPVMAKGLVPLLLYLAAWAFGEARGAFRSARPPRP